MGGVPEIGGGGWPMRVNEQRAKAMEGAAGGGMQAESRGGSRRGRRGARDDGRAARRLCVPA